MAIVIYVDADACPVKDEVVRVAERHKIQVYIVCNGGIRPHPHPLVETVIVPDGPDVADKWMQIGRQRMTLWSRLIFHWRPR